MSTEAFIDVTKIETNEDRREGGMGELGHLKESMARLGLLNSITVRGGLPRGRYRILAGRRRLEAARQLGWKEIRALIYDADEEIDEKSVQLAENTNRLDMHPLDEAVLFHDMLQKGSSIDELSMIYMRSRTAIYQRAKLANLIQPIKDLFREGRLNITSAAAIACLEEEKQSRVMASISGCKGEIDKWSVSRAIANAEDCRLNHLFPLDDTCEACQHRTRYTDATLFPDMYSQGDYCLMSHCYIERYRESIFTSVRQAVADEEELFANDPGIIFILEQNESPLSGSTIDITISDPARTISFPVLAPDKWVFYSDYVGLFKSRPDLVRKGIYVGKNGAGDSPVIEFVLREDARKLRIDETEDEDEPVIEISGAEEKDAYRVAMEEDYYFERNARRKVLERIALEEFGLPHSAKAVHKMLFSVFSKYTVVFVAGAHHAEHDADTVLSSSAWLEAYAPADIRELVYDCMLYEFLSRRVYISPDIGAPYSDFKDTQAHESLELLGREIEPVIDAIRDEYRKLIRERVDLLVDEHRAEAYGDESGDEYEEEPEEETEGEPTFS